MRIIGLDVGTKTIGVAVSDPFGWTAQGVTTIRRTNMEKDVQEVLAYVRQYEVEEIMLGMPLNMNGTRGPSAENAEALGNALAEVWQGKISYRDERLSTVAAERYLIEGDVSRKNRKGVIDKMAAVFILQGYLDYLAAHPQKAIDNSAASSYTESSNTNNRKGYRIMTEELFNDEVTTDALITLIDEDDVEHLFAVEAILDVEGKKYAVLAPQDDDYDSDEAIILRFDTTEDGEEVLSDIEDDDEWNKVADAYEEEMAEAE